MPCFIAFCVLHGHLVILTIFVYIVLISFAAFCGHLVILTISVYIVPFASFCGSSVALSWYFDVIYMPFIICHKTTLNSCKFNREKKMVQGNNQCPENKDPWVPFTHVWISQFTYSVVTLHWQKENEMVTKCLYTVRDFSPS